MNVRTTKTLGAGAMALLLALGACTVELPTDDNPDDTGPPTFAAFLGVDLADYLLLESGLYYRDEVVGGGETAVAGSVVGLTIQGWLPNGTIFQPEAQFNHTVGGGTTIVGFDEGVTFMKLGGTRWIIMPPALGYGAAGNPPQIPGNSWLVFKLEFNQVL